MQIDVDAPETVFVSRQPILDATGKVFGYELLHRETGATAPEGGETAEAAGARGLTDVVLGLGLDTLAEGKPAFLNFTRDLLVGQAATLLPPAKTVIQLRRGLQVDEEVVAAPARSCTTPATGWRSTSSPTPSRSGCCRSSSSSRSTSAACPPPRRRRW